MPRRRFPQWVEAEALDLLAFGASAQQVAETLALRTQYPVEKSDVLNWSRAAGNVITATRNALKEALFVDIALGGTVESAADRVDVPYKTAERWVRQRGGVKALRTRHVEQYPPEKRRAALEDMASPDATQIETAEQHGVARHTLQRWIREDKDGTRDDAA